MIDLNDHSAQLSSAIYKYFARFCPKNGKTLKRGSAIHLSGQTLKNGGAGLTYLTQL